MKTIFILIISLCSTVLIAQNDSITPVFLKVEPVNLTKCAKEVIITTKTNWRGTKQIVKGRCFSITGYLTQADPPQPIYDNGKRFRRVEYLGFLPYQ
ncbi:MAG: hypothetical protein HRT72_06455 [Flavobacteriales bacterium]|nr:hypothetical protein [Flavobacteriales bacterium]